MEESFTPVNVYKERNNDSEVRESSLYEQSVTVSENTDKGCLRVKYRVEYLSIKEKK
jgi:hypothetical protein